MIEVREQKQGFSLIELLIVVAIIGIIASIAYPSYTKYMLKSRRSEAITTLLSTQNKLEQYYSQNNAYPTTLAGLPTPPSPTANYSYSYIRNSANSYTLTASASTATQMKDIMGTTNCTVLTLDNKGNQAPPACWAH